MPKEQMDSARRQFVRALGGAGVLLAGLGKYPRLAQAQSPAGGLDVTQLRDGLFQVSGAGGNVVVLASADGLVMVDSGAAEHASSLKKVLAERFAAAPVRVLFNTHWHLDHTGGNDELVKNGMTVVAHENTRLWMSTKFFVDWENKRYFPRAKAALPNTTFVASDPQPQDVSVGNGKAVYAQLNQAHTDGDIYVAFPQHNVIAAGGAVTAASYPVLDYITGGWIGGMVEATRKLIAMSDAETLIVPDAGPPQRRADLEAQLVMLETVRERIEKIALEGRGVEDMIAEQVTKEFDARYGGDSALFISNAYEGMWWNRLRGTVA
jgi:glyoxylase-like metal-dependent hydrolase (beta-lactamase superfamily II)